MTEPQAPARFPEAAALASAVAPAPPAVTKSADGTGDRPELLIAATFVGGFLTAKILKRIGSG